MNGLDSIVQDLFWGIGLPLLLTIIELGASFLASPDEPDSAIGAMERDDTLAGPGWLGPIRASSLQQFDAGINLCVSALGADLGAAVATRTSAVALFTTHVALLFVAAVVERVLQRVARSHEEASRQALANVTTTRRVIILNAIGLLALFTAFANVSQVGGPALLALIAILLGLGMVIFGWRKRTRHSETADL